MVGEAPDGAQALRLAERGLFTTTPNPRVGCVLVRDGVVVGEGWHEKAGEPHAEVHALRQAGEAARGATAYVTLEPCPMCAGAIIQARIPTVVYGATDPKAGAVRTLFRLLEDPRLNHRCLIVSDVLAEPCSQILTRFFQKQRQLGKK